MYAGRQQLGDVWADIGSALTSGAQLVQTLRPPAPSGTTSTLPPVQYIPQTQPAQRSIFSDPMTLTMIALGGMAVLILLLKR